MALKENKWTGGKEGTAKVVNPTQKKSVKKPTKVAPLAHSWNGRQVSKSEFETLTRQKAIADKNKARQGTSNGYMVTRPGLGLPMPPPPMPMQQGPAPMGAGAPAPAPQGGAPVRMPTPKRPPASSAQLPDDNMNAIA